MFAGVIRPTQKVQNSHKILSGNTVRAKKVTVMLRLLQTSLSTV